MGRYASASVKAGSVAGIDHQHDWLHPGTDENRHHQFQYFADSLISQTETRAIGKAFPAQSRYLNDGLHRPADEETDRKTVNSETVDKKYVVCDDDNV